MKKIFMILTALLVLGLIAGNASAHTYTFPNETFVHSKISDGGIWKAWVDTIPGGDTSIFQTFGADLTLSGLTYTLTIYTNLPSQGATGANFSDIFFDGGQGTGLPTTWEYVLDITGPSGTTPVSNMGNIIQSGNFSTSYDIWEPKKTYLYGAEFDPSFSKAAPGESNYFTGAYVPTRYDGGGKDIGDVTASWNNLSTKGGTYQHVFTWLSSEFDPYATSKIWIMGTGDCANDASGGTLVPLPGALLLLSAGLVRLVAYARKRRSQV